MKRRLLGIALLGAAVWAMTGEASAFGGRKKSNDCGTSAGYSTGCGTATGCGSYVVSYVDQKVMVSEWVSVKEEYKYWVSEPVMKKEKVKVKEQARKDEAFKYTVNEWVTVKEKVKVAESKAVTKEMEFTTYTSVRVVTKQMRTVCEWVCVPVTVTCAAPVYAAPSCGTASGGGLFHRICGKKHNDCAAPCATGCETPCAPITTVVMQRQMVTRQIEVDVTTCQQVAHKHKKPVTTYEIVWVEKEVDVKKCVAVEKTGMHKVGYWVDVEKEITVTTYNKVEKTGVHDVKKCIQTEKIVKVAVHTYVPAPVVAPVVAPCASASPCASSCASPCTTTMSAGCGTSARGGLFKGKLCK